MVLAGLQQLSGWHVVRNNGIGTNNGVFPNCDIADYCCANINYGTPSHYRRRFSAPLSTIPILKHNAWWPQ